MDARRNPFYIALAAGFLALTLLIGSDPTRAGGTVIYVDADAAFGGDGSSWGKAYRYLQDALDYTNANGGTDYQIWVAEGVYYPDEDGDGDHVNDDQNESFLISYNNVALYGGFVGTEVVRRQRDWEAHITVLSGDVEGNDTTDSHGVVITTTHISGDNACHVLWLDGESNEPITGITVIDGFTITAGQAKGGHSSLDRGGGGMFCAGHGSGDKIECSPSLAHVTFSGNLADWGGAMYNYGYSGISKPSLTDVVFSGNHADELGGAMYNYGGGDGESSPILTDVTFSDNAAADYGGAMYNNAFGGTSSPTLTHVIFSDNSARNRGGAMYNDGWEGRSSPTLMDVIFSDNTTGGHGGAMYNDGTNEGISSPTLTHVTFSGNSASYNGGAMYNDGSDVGESTPMLANVIFSGNSAGYSGGAIYNDGTNMGISSPTLINVTLGNNSAGHWGGAMYNNGYSGTSIPVLTNAILWGNTAFEGDQIYNYYATSSIGCSDVEGGWDGSGIYNYGTGGTNNLGGNIDADPLFVDIGNDDLHLQDDSPAIDAGNNYSVIGIVNTDRDDRPRFTDLPGVTDTGIGSPPIVDMGAYEVQLCAYLPLVVKQ
ncbi:MAG: choice-of-anchor Q domain-containing protein [Anaerolineae bacterium]